MLIIKATKSIRFLQLNNNSTIYKFATASASSTTSSKSSKKTLYQILQVPSSATMTNIKQNYLRLAKIYHPDIYKGKDKDRFTKIQEAYKTLSDRVKRNKYDEDIGIARKTNQSQQFIQRQDNPKNQTGKPKNPMQYQTASQYQKINLDQEFNKFFNQKTKTQFEQIRLNQQPQIRSMSQAERIRRHVTNIYDSPQNLGKANYQKQFGSILNDQINQKNRMHEDNVKNQQNFIKINTQKNIKKMKFRVWIIFGVVCLVTIPMIFSFVTKYRLDKQRQKLVKQAINQVNNQIQEQMLRARLKYQQ